MDIGDIRFSLDSHKRVRAESKKEKGSIASQTVDSLLLLAILEKLEEIRCGIIDVENEINPR